MRCALVIASLLVCCVAAGTARADGDPASDYLLGSQVFLPFDAKLPQAKQQQLIATVDAANRAGYKIRVAVIWSSYDLGAVTSLWRKPQLYARFLGQELEFVYKQRLLIVMPNGFGITTKGKPLPKEYALISKIPTGADAVGLVDAADLAVQKLARSAGVHVTASAAAKPKSSHRSVVVLLIAIAALAVLVLLRLALRRP